MSRMTSLSLDSCERNLLNEHGSKTLGNVLCEKAGLWVPGQQFQSFVTVSAMIFECDYGLMMKILAILPHLARKG